MAPATVPAVAGDRVSRGHDDPPTNWSDVDGTFLVPGSENVYVALIGDKATGSDVWVWHWHTPNICRHCGSSSAPDGDHSCSCPHSGEECATLHPPVDRWSLAACGNHQVLSWEPLHLDPSLACFDGCPSHGWIRDGVWTDA